MVATNTRRPVGATLLALALGWLAIAGFGNALMWRTVPSSLNVAESSPLGRFIEAASSPLFTAVALAYGVTALVACIGLWRMRPWMARAVLAWVTAVAITGVWMLLTVPGELLLGGPLAALAFVVGGVTLLLLVYRYVRRIAPSDSRAQRGR
jgi:hypothetical protein